MTSLISGGRYGSGVVAEIVILIVQKNCKTFLSNAISAVDLFFSPSPTHTAIPSSSKLDLILPASNSAGVAAQLKGTYPEIDAEAIDSLVWKLCQDIKGVARYEPSEGTTRVFDAAEDFRRVLPGAGIKFLNVSIGIQKLVLERCPKTSKYSMDNLASSLLNELLSNTPGRSDFLPPVLSTPTWNWVQSAANEIELRWVGFDFNNVSYEVWVNENNGGWRSLYQALSNSPARVTGVYSWNNYWFAVRATDDEGNRSSWKYLNPCVSCQ